VQDCTLNDDGATRQCLHLQKYESILHGCYLATTGHVEYVIRYCACHHYSFTLTKDHLDVV